MCGASCVLAGPLPFSFALSHSAITEHATKDPEGISDRDNATDSTLEPCGGCVMSITASVGHSEGSPVCPALLRELKISKAGQSLVR